MITILDTHENQAFSIGERMVALTPEMDLADAKLIDQQYPGVYLTIFKVDPKSDKKAEATK